jgi:hypothetical protein
MERIFSFASSNPKLTAHGIYSYRNLLSGKAANAPYNWGFSFIKPTEEIVLKRRPFHLETFDIFDILKHHNVIKGIGNIASTEKAIPLSETPPFRYKSWFFTMIGESKKNHKISSWLLGTLPPFLKRNMSGTSEKEHLFHLFLSYLHDSGIISAYKFPPIELITALSKTQETWENLHKDAGIENSRSVIIVTNGRLIAAMASHENIAGFRYNDGFSDACPYCRDTTSTDSEIKGHPDLKSLFLHADLKTDPRDYGLSPLDPDKILLFQNEQLEFFNK